MIRMRYRDHTADRQRDPAPRFFVQRDSPPAARWRTSLLLMAFATIGTGCTTTRSADYSNVNLIDVSGTVTLDGVALNNARIEFESPNATCSYAHTDEAGHYQLLYTSERPGCLPGDKLVRITVPMAGEEEDPDAAPSSRGITIPALYNSASILRAQVSADNRQFDFQLSTDGGQPTID